VCPEKWQVRRVHVIEATAQPRASVPGELREVSYELDTASGL
jgi:hypothetical protein